MRKKTSIYLDSEQDRALARYAARRGISKAEAIRRAVADILSEPASRPRISAVGVVDGPEDISQNDERYLLEGFGRD